METQRLAWAGLLTYFPEPGFFFSATSRSQSHLAWIILFRCVRIGLLGSSKSIQVSKSRTMRPMIQLELSLTYPVFPLITVHEQSGRGMSLFSPTADTTAMTAYATHPR